MEIAASLRFREVLLRIHLDSLSMWRRVAHVGALFGCSFSWGVHGCFPLSFLDNPDKQSVLRLYDKILDEMMVFVTDLSIEKGKERSDPSSV